jgi:hypothetical protein
MRRQFDLLTHGSPSIAGAFTNIQLHNLPEFPSAPCGLIDETRAMDESVTGCVRGGIIGTENIQDSREQLLIPAVSKSRRNSKDMGKFGTGALSAQLGLDAPRFISPFRSSAVLPCIAWWGMMA